MKPGTIKVQSNIKACQGCRACEAICSVHHFDEVNPNSTGIKIKEKDEFGKFTHIVCQQCIDMPCADVCPKDVITRDSFTGSVTIGEDCDGCGNCIDACPIGAINLTTVNNETVAFKCDFCGGIPQCVTICPRHALSW